MNERPYALWYDYSASNPITLQGDNPLNDEFLPIKAENRRALTDLNGLTYNVGDLAVAPHGTRTIVWSSEGYSFRGVTIPALTGAQKLATGKSGTTNFNALLDLSAYKTLTMVTVLTSFTGGTTPTFQFELDALDDASTATVIPLYKSAAASVATSYYTALGAEQGLAPTITGFTVVSVPVSFTPNGQVQWMVTGSPTAIAWTSFLYGNF